MEKETPFLIDRELHHLVGKKLDDPVVVQSAMDLLSKHHLGFNDMDGDPEDPLVLDPIYPTNQVKYYPSVPYIEGE